MKQYRWKVIARGYVEAYSPGEAVEKLTDGIHGYVTSVEDEWELYVESYDDTEEDDAEDRQDEEEQR